MDFRAFLRNAESTPGGGAGGSGTPCAYCGGTYFEPPEDNGRVQRVECEECGGTMVSHGAGWMPDLIGQPENHPSDRPDPRSGGVPGVGAVPLRREDLSSRTAAEEGRYADRITLMHYKPGDDEHNDLDSHYPGWTHGVLHAYGPRGDRADPIGLMEFSAGPDQIRIHETRVHQDHRRRGVATSLNNALVRAFPHHEIDRGGATEDGEEFRKSLGSTDWCRHRHAEHCWLPRQAPADGVALYVPQDRGECPWKTASMQQINCPVSEPGPMAGMSRMAKRPEPEPLKRGLGPDHDRKNCPVCNPPKRSKHQRVGAPIPAPHPNPLGGNSWFHGTTYHPDEDHDYVSKNTRFTPPHPTLDGVPFGSGKTEFHGDPAGKLKTPDRIQWTVGGNAKHHWNTDLGVHFSSEHSTASDFAKGGSEEQSRVAHTTLHMSNPAHYEDEHELGVHAIKWAHSQGHRFLPEQDEAHGHFVVGDDHLIEGAHANKSPWHDENDSPYGYVQDSISPSNTDMRKFVSTTDSHGLNEHHSTYDLNSIDRYLSAHPKREEITQGFREHLQSKGHDGIIYGNEIEGSFKHRCAIAFPSTHFNVHKWEWQHPQNPHHTPKAQEDKNQHELFEKSPYGLLPKQYAASLNEFELRFHMVAAWRDVRAKAVRIRREGGVSIVSSMANQLTGHVQGDTGVYETQVNYVPGSFKVGYWQCGCAWSSYAWGRSPAYRRFEGRMCSHALALVYEAQARGVYTREVQEDTQRPAWLRDKVRVRHDRETREHDVRAASLALDPDGVYPVDHGLDLARSPIHAVAQEAYDASGDPADAMRAYLAVGVPHEEARSFLGQLSPSLAKAADEPPSEPTHAGVVLKAQDTGRVLMIQRSFKDDADPARGKWEFPGGGREEGDLHSLHSGIREFEEETGQHFPTGGHVSHVWQSPNGVYQGHVVVVPNESCLHFENGRSTVNPDDPDGDDHEQSAWWDPEEARKNPGLREELKQGPWKHIKAASLSQVAVLPADPDQHKTCPNCGHQPYKGVAACPNCGTHLDSQPMHVQAETTQKKRRPQYPYSGWGLGGWWLWDQNNPSYGTNDDEAGQDVGGAMDGGSEGRLTNFRQRVADYASNDQLGELQPDWRPKPPPLAPGPGQPENPGSTGWATSQDPPEWENAAQRSETMSLSPGLASRAEPDTDAETMPWGYDDISEFREDRDHGELRQYAEFHNEPEPALPSTTAEDDVEDPGSQYRSQMSSDIDATESLMPNDGRTASVAEIVAQFHATAAAKQLAAPNKFKGSDPMNIAEAARQHLAKAEGMQRTALKNFSPSERNELITEGVHDRARNFDELQIENTHYATIEAALQTESSLNTDGLFD